MTPAHHSHAVRDNVGTASELAKRLLGLDVLIDARFDHGPAVAAHPLSARGDNIFLRFHVLGEGLKCLDVLIGACFDHAPAVLTHLSLAAVNDFLGGVVLRVLRELFRGSEILIGVTPSHLPTPLFLVCSREGAQ